MPKALGKDINEFYNNHLPENCYIDDDAGWIEDFNNEDGLCLVPTEKYEINDFGWIFDDNTGENIGKFSTVFKKWLQHQTTVTLAIEVPKEKEEEVRQKLKELGIKVI